MMGALEKAKEKMEPFRGHPDAKPEWSISWECTYQNIIEFSKIAETTNRKVIIINMIDHFLRCTF